MKGCYEYQNKLRTNKLCPFKLIDEIQSKSRGVCNWHKNIEILYIADGEGYIQYDTVDFSVKKGDIIVVNTGSLHCIGSNDTVHYKCIIIDEEFCNGNGIDTKICLFDRKFRDTLTEKLISTASDTINEYNEICSPINIARARCSVLSLLINLFTEHLKTTIGETRMIKPAENYVKTVLS